jgi:hypothetical protein
MASLSAAVRQRNQRAAGDGASTPTGSEELSVLHEKIDRLAELVATLQTQKREAPAPPPPSAASSRVGWKRRACSTLALICSILYFLWVHAAARGAVGPRGGAWRAALAAAPAPLAAGAAPGGGRVGAGWAARAEAAAFCDPAAPFSPGDLPPVPQGYVGNVSGRSLYITVLTADHIGVLLENWPSQEEHLLRPWDDHFMLAVPARDAARVVDVVTDPMGPLGWAKVMDFTAPQLAYPCDEGRRDMVAHPAAGWYRSRGNVTVLLVVRNFRRPRFIDNATFEELAKPCGLLKCCQKDGSDKGKMLTEAEVEMSKEFSTINLAFVYHLLVDLEMVDAYDYIFKVDADIKFNYAPPRSPGTVMRDTGCVIMQSEILEVGSHLHCIQPLLHTIGRFAKIKDIPVKSQRHGWCEQMNLYMVRGVAAPLGAREPQSCLPLFPLTHPRPPPLTAVRQLCWLLAALCARARAARVFKVAL